MTKTTVKIAAGVLATAVATAVVFGPRVVKNLWLSGREQLQDKAREFVDPKVELREAVKQAEAELPKAVTDIKFAIRATDEQIAELTEALQQRQEGLVLIERDIERLAGPVRDGKPCALRGETLSAKAARQEAVRLLEKKKDYEQQIRKTTTLLETSRDHRESLQAELVKAETAVAEFKYRAKSVQTKIALNEAAQRVEQIQVQYNGHALAAIPSSLDELERDLDRRLEENGQRARMRESLSAEDEYINTVREEDLLAELDKLHPAEPGAKDED